MRRAECPACHLVYDHDRPLPYDGGTAVKYPVSCIVCKFVPLVIYYKPVL